MFPKPRSQTASRPGSRCREAVETFVTEIGFEPRPFDCPRTIARIGCEANMLEARTYKFFTWGYRTEPIIMRIALTQPECLQRAPPLPGARTATPHSLQNGHKPDHHPPGQVMPYGIPPIDSGDIGVRAVTASLSRVGRISISPKNSSCIRSTVPSSIRKRRGI